MKVAAYISQQISSGCFFQKLLFCIKLALTLSLITFNIYIYEQSLMLKYLLC